PLAGRLQRVDLRVRAAVLLVPALPGDAAAAYHHGADERVGLDGPPAALGQFQRPPHPGFIVHGCVAGVSSPGGDSASASPFGSPAPAGPRASEAIRSPSRRSIRRTPWVLRPTRRMLSAFVRITMPPVVTSITSSPSRTASTPTTGPFRSVAR